ncbi:MAG TPA: threonine synthase [Candidatus Angelobacter sp.]|nr:threonine synthase [Candidatus Angelobacter sp.]
MAKIQYFECSKCGAHLTADVARNVCPNDGGPLYVRYDLAAIRESSSRDAVAHGANSMWRYAAVLPDAEPVTLGEGMTPMLRSRKHSNLLIKDEGLNPTGSFKARGMAAALTMARHYGLKKLAAPSAGNAGGALAAYAAAAGVEAYVFMPKDVPLANRLEVEACGAHLTLVDGLISDCGRMVAERKDAEGWFDVSTLKEPFRIEGKKTMGYEVAEQFGWRLPDAILYPTGGGVGLIGMWKAFEEMEQLGWISTGKRPKMICIQASGCAPIIKALQEEKAVSEMWPNASTLAAGLRVPKAYGDFIILDIARKSGGTAVAVGDDDIMAAVKRMAGDEGILAAPEGAAALAAYEMLLAQGFLKPADEVVLFNTGSGYKYLDTFASYWGITPASVTIELPKSRNIGGIIGPY